MKFITCLAVLALAITLASSASGEQQRILRRVIKSTPTATNLGRIRLVTVRSPSAESGAVAEISSKEAASFGQRSANETSQSAGVKSKSASAPSTTTSSSTTTTTGASTSTSTTTQAPASSSAAPIKTAASSTPASVTSTTSKPKASDRQQAAPVEVELLSSAPSSWQSMTSVEAPAAMLIATGTRAAQSDLGSSSSNLHSSEVDAAPGQDFLRSSATKGGASYTQQSAGETFSRIRQQSSKQQQQQQQSFFYPQPAPQAPRPVGKTNYQQASKTNWYQPTSTTPRPAPIIQERYEQQNEQYTEQQAEYGAAPLGQAEPFAFDFKTNDNSGNGQYRKEESDKNGVVRGSYGYTDASGIYRHVEYVADQNGFRANIKSNEPGLIGETQPASIQLAGGAAPANNQRLSAAENADWSGLSGASSNDEVAPSADLSALASPDFESSHKPERVRTPRNFRN